MKVKTKSSYGIIDVQKKKMNQIRNYLLYYRILLRMKVILIYSKKKKTTTRKIQTLLNWINIYIYDLNVRKKQLEVKRKTKEKIKYETIRFHKN